MTGDDSVHRKEAATDSLNIDCDQDKKQQMKKIRVLLTLLLGSKYLFKYCCAGWIKISVEFHRCVFLSYLLAGGNLFVLKWCDEDLSKSSKDELKSILTKCEKEDVKTVEVDDKEINKELFDKCVIGEVHKLRRWSKHYILPGRLTWVSLIGVPVSFWSELVFKKITAVKGQKFKVDVIEEVGDIVELHIEVASNNNSDSNEDDSEEETDSEDDESDDDDDDDVGGGGRPKDDGGRKRDKDEEEDVYGNRGTEDVNKLEKQDKDDLYF
ncbi:hypothetical protein Tco_0059534 [Tanacetum coccineum]